MKLPPGHGSTLDIAQGAAASLHLPRLVSASLCLLSMAIVVTAPTVMVDANQKEGQGVAHNLKSGEAPIGKAEKGKELFKKYGCYECHGSHGQIASRAGPALAPDLIPFEGFVAYIRHPTGSMPAYTEKVASEQDLADIYAFLKSTPHPPAAKNIPILNLVAWGAAHRGPVCFSSAGTTGEWVSCSHEETRGNLSRRLSLRRAPAISLLAIAR